MSQESLKRVLLELKGEAKKMRKAEMEGRLKPKAKLEAVKEKPADAEEHETEEPEETEEKPEEEAEKPAKEDASVARILKKMGI